jgi:hypothetical protein
MEPNLFAPLALCVGPMDNSCQSSSKPDIQIATLCSLIRCSSLSTSAIVCFTLFRNSRCACVKFEDICDSLPSVDHDGNCLMNHFVRQEARKGAPKAPLIVVTDHEYQLPAARLVPCHAWTKLFFVVFTASLMHASAGSFSSTNDLNLHVVVKQL